jgi:hypothetical protein
MVSGSSSYDDNLPPGSRPKRPAFDNPGNGPSRRKKTAEKKYIALPAPGSPPKGSDATNLPQPSAEEKSSFLRTFPREVRNLIYKNLAALFTTSDHTLIIDRAILDNIPSFSPLSVIARSLSSPIILVRNKQFLIEYVEELFLSGSIRLVGGPSRIHEWLHGQQHEMSNLHHIEFCWEGMPSNLLEGIEHFMDMEICPLLDFIRLSTQVRSITIPLYFLERHDQPAYAVQRSVRRPDEVRLARSNRRQIPLFWVMFIYHALQNLLIKGSKLKEVIIRYYPYDMWTLHDPAVNVQNLVSKKPSEWDSNVSPDLCRLRDKTADVGWVVDLDELFSDISVYKRGEAEEGKEALIRFRKPDN